MYVFFCVGARWGLYVGWKNWCKIYVSLALLGNPRLFSEVIVKCTSGPG